MSFRRPGLEELQLRVTRDVATGMGLGGLLPRTMLRVLAESMAGAVYTLFGYLTWTARQVFPDTAEDEFLERWSKIWGVSRKPATFAKGPATFKGTDGVVIPAGTRLRRDDGWLFATDAAYTVGTATSGIALGYVTALEAGADGNTPFPGGWTLEQPLTGILAGVGVGHGGTGDVDGAEDAETDEALRGRLLSRLRDQPKGGAASDYRIWSLEVPGVTRVWVIPGHLGIGTVGVAFMRDDDEGSPFPDATEVAELEAYLDVRRPVTADVVAFAPEGVAVDFEIVLVPDNPSLRALVEVSLRDLIERDGEPGGTILVSRIREAISTTPGESDHTLVLPAADVELTGTQLATMGAVTWS